MNGTRTTVGVIGLLLALILVGGGVLVWLAPVPAADMTPAREILPNVADWIGSRRRWEQFSGSPEISALRSEEGTPERHKRSSAGGFPDGGRRAAKPSYRRKPVSMKSSPRSR